MEINNELILYVVRNSDGQYFRAKGYGGYGNTWVSDINKAKIYGKIGGARGTITWFSNSYPEYPVPQLVKLNVTGMEVIDETERVRKVKEKKIVAEVAKKKRRAEIDLKNAERDFEEAKSKLESLKKKQ